MYPRLIASAVFAAAVFHGAAFAASNPASTNTASNAAQPAQTLPSKIKQKLQQDGFSNVQIVAGSFLVSAKDKNGDPVEMVIRPNSMTMITEAVPGSNNSGGSGDQSGNQTNSGTSH